MIKKKIAVLVADGMNDKPLEELGGRTPLEIARTPNMDYFAERGKIGQALFVPEGMTPGSDIANLAIFGYDPRIYFAGRGPLEAINMDIEIGRDEVAFRCNLITVENNKLVDYSSGHITTKEARVLIKVLNNRLSEWGEFRFYPGVSYRHLLVVKGNPQEYLQLKCVPPHDIMGRAIDRYLPRSRDNKKLVELMLRAGEILRTHEINQVRIDLKENPANMIWPWGQGVNIELPSFVERFGLSGCVISAVDLIKGIGKSIGLRPVNVPGATGYYDTNYEGKAEHALCCLQKNDFVFVHVEAPDEAGHNGDIRAKITAIENFDKYIVKAFRDQFSDKKHWRVMILADHPTPVALRTHTSDPVTFLVSGEGIEKDKYVTLNEITAADSSLKYPHGHELMESLVHSKKV